MAWRRSASIGTQRPGAILGRLFKGFASSPVPPQPRCQHQPSLGCEVAGMQALDDGVEVKALEALDLAVVVDMCRLRRRDGFKHVDVLNQVALGHRPVMRFTGGAIE